MYMQVKQTWASCANTVKYTQVCLHYYTHTHTDRHAHTHTHRLSCEIQPIVTDFLLVVQWNTLRLPQRDHKDFLIQC